MPPTGASGRVGLAVRVYYHDKSLTKWLAEALSAYPSSGNGIDERNGRRADSSALHPGVVSLFAIFLAAGCGVGLRFVGARAIDAGHGDSQQTEIDSELAAVVIEMVEAHAANAGDTWHGENLLAAS